MRERGHAIIIGGGIAGPSLALFLEKAGISSTVYEAHPRSAGAGLEHASGVRIGGGFQVAPNGMNVLKELGLASTLVARSASAKEMCFVTPSGRVLARFPNGRPERTGVTAVATTRAALIETLLAAVENKGIRVEHEKRLRDITHTAGGDVVAHFEDGTTATGSFLVGADGIGSLTRRLIFPDAQRPAYQGLVGFGALLSPSECPALAALESADTPAARRLREGSITFVVGPTGQFGYNQLDDRGLICWWTHVPYENEPTPAEIKAMSTETKPMLLERCLRWHEPVPTFLKATGDLIVAGVYSLPPLPSWHQGNVVLLGDAAHGMSPSSGIGASLALEDGMYLAKLLRNRSMPLEEVFRSFKRDRTERTERCNATARQRDARERAKPGPVARRIRDAMLSVVLPIVGERSLRWQYEYRIDWDGQ